MKYKSTLEQWHQLETVIHTGGFAQAAEALHKSQSSISYNIRQLQDRLGVPLLEIKGRKAELTDVGKTMLARARILLRDVESFESMASDLATGWGGEITLAVEQLFPTDILMLALDAFGCVCGPVRVKVLETILSGTEEALTSGKADIAIVVDVPQGYVGTPLYCVEFVAVARSDHDLFKVGAIMLLPQLRQFRQVVVKDSGLEKEQDAGWLEAAQRWTVSHMSTSIAAVKKGLGFAWLPKTQIQDELDSGLLKPIPVQQGATRKLILNMIDANATLFSPPKSMLMSCIQSSCQPSGQ